MSAPDEDTRTKWINGVQLAIVKKKKDFPHDPTPKDPRRRSLRDALESMNPFRQNGPAEVPTSVNTESAAANEGDGTPVGVSNDNARPSVVSPATASPRTVNSGSPKTDGKSETTIVHEGFLIKRGALVQSWNARWFVLTCTADYSENSKALPEYKLTYYKDSIKGPMKGSFIVDKTTHIESTLDIGEYSNVFIISRQVGDANDRTIYVSAMNAKAEAAWIETLNVVIRKLIVLDMQANGIMDEGLQKKLIINNAKAHSVEAAERIRTRRLQQHAAMKGRGNSRRPGGKEVNPLAASMAAREAAAEDTPVPAHKPSLPGEDSEDEDEEEGVASPPSSHSVAAAAAAVASSGGPTGDLPRGWQEVKTADGTVYYYHVIARVSRWDRPTPEVAAAVEQRLRENEDKAAEATQRRKAELEARKAEEEARSQKTDALGEKIRQQVDNWRFAPGSRRQIKALQDLMLDLPLVIPSLIPDIGALGLPPAGSGAAAPEVIRKVYLKIVRVIHPDKLPPGLALDVQMTAEAVFVELTEHYNRYKKQHE